MRIFHAERATLVEVCYLIGDYYFKSMKFAQTQTHIRQCLAFLLGFGLLPPAPHRFRDVSASASSTRHFAASSGAAAAAGVESDAFVNISEAAVQRVELDDTRVSVDEVPPFGDRWSLALVFNAWATLALSTSGRIDALLNLVRT